LEEASFLVFVLSALSYLLAHFLPF